MPNNRLILIGLSFLIITVNGAVITTTTTTELNPSAREIQPPPSPSPTFNYNRHLLGVPGNDFPIFESIPKTKFECVLHMPGYYADMEALCQVFHICQDDGRQDRFLCPNGTLFHQKTFVCEWWYNVDCSTSASHYHLNTIFQHPASPLTPEVDDYAKLGDPASLGDLKVAANTIRPSPAVLSTTAREQNRPLTTIVKDDEVKHLKEPTVTEELLFTTAPSIIQPEKSEKIIPSLTIGEELAQIPENVLLVQDQSGSATLAQSPENVLSVEDQSGSATEKLLIIDEMAATESTITESPVDHQLNSSSTSTPMVNIELTISTTTTTTTESSDINTTALIELELTTKADHDVSEPVESNTLRMEEEEELVTTGKPLIVNDEEVVPKRLKVRTPSNFAYGRKLSKKNSSVK